MYEVLAWGSSLLYPCVCVCVPNTNRQQNTHHPNPQTNKETKQEIFGTTTCKKDM